MIARPDPQPDQTFGHWTVLRETERRGGARWYLCRCGCGVEVEVRRASLVSGDSTKCRSCRRATHRSCRTPEYTVWAKMLQRARGTYNSQYYADRGIGVCDRWVGKEGFKNFLEDMGPRPSLDHSIDRKNNDLGYSKDNCRWATRSEQGRNKRNNIVLTIDGITATLADQAERSHLPYRLVYDRFRRGWPLERILQS